MLFALWSPTGGSGTSVLTAACAGPRPSGAPRSATASGVPSPISTATSRDLRPRCRADRRPRRLAERRPGGTQRGARPSGRRGRARCRAPAARTWAAGAHHAPGAESGRGARGRAARRVVTGLVDCGPRATPPRRAIVEVADVSVVVVRGCYLAVRAAVHSPALARPPAWCSSKRTDRSLGEGGRRRPRPPGARAGAGEGGDLPRRRRRRARRHACPSRWRGPHRRSCSDRPAGRRATARPHDGPRSVSTTTRAEATRATAAARGHRRRATDADELRAHAARAPARRRATPRDARASTRLLGEFVDEVGGLGPLEPFLADPASPR